MKHLRAGLFLLMLGLSQLQAQVCTCILQQEKNGNLLLVSGPAPDQAGSYHCNDGLVIRPWEADQEWYYWGVLALRSHGRREVTITPVGTISPDLFPWLQQRFPETWSHLDRDQYYQHLSLGSASLISGRKGKLDWSWTYAGEAPVVSPGFSDSLHLRWQEVVDLGGLGGFGASGEDMAEAYFLYLDIEMAILLGDTTWGNAFLEMEQLLVPAMGPELGEDWISSGFWLAMMQKIPARGRFYPRTGIEYSICD